jgi:hypothetical protein
VISESQGATSDNKDAGSDKTPWIFVSDHVALLASVLGALIFAFRCVAVTEGDPYVASMLVAESSIGDAIRALLPVVIPTLLLTISFSAGFVAAQRIFVYGRRDLVTNRVTIGLIIGSVTASLGAFYYSGAFQRAGGGSIRDLLVLVLSIAALALAPFLLFFPIMMLLVETASPGRERFRLRLVSTAALVVVVAIAVVGLGEILGGKTFWLPRERLVFKNEAPFTGYVLKVSEDQVVILNDEPRVIVEKHKELLEDRDFCYPEDHEARSSNVKSDAPVCP